MRTIGHFMMGSWIFFIMATCSSTTGSYVSYADWDTNNDQKINRSEFVEAYLAQDFFERWSKGASSIRYDELFNEAFSTIDSDKDGKLSLVEFNSQIKLFYFGLFNGSFNSWDDDSNASIDQAEFKKHVANSNLASLWDTDSNKRITGREMAGGMFYICDSDSDGSISDTELTMWKRNR